MWIFRKVYHLEKYITKKHFVNVGVLLMILAAFFGYFTFSEYLTKWYGSRKHDELLISILFDRYYGSFIFAHYIGVLMPMIVIAIPRFRTIRAITLSSVVVIIALWLNRYLIVVPTLESPYMPIQESRAEWIHYSGTWVEWVLTLGGIAAFCLFFTVASRWVPVINVSEENEEQLIQKRKESQVELKS